MSNRSIVYFMWLLDGKEIEGYCLSSLSYWRKQLVRFCIAVNAEYNDKVFKKINVKTIFGDEPLKTKL